MGYSLLIGGYKEEEDEGEVGWNAPLQMHLSKKIASPKPHLCIKTASPIFSKPTPYKPSIFAKCTSTFHCSFWQ